MPKVTRVNSEPDSERGRGLPEAVRLWPRRLATDLFTLRRDPFPPLRKPRRLNRLPQVLGALVAYMFGGLTTTNLTNHYDITAGTALPVGIVTGVSVFLAMFRPIAAWWLALITGIVAALSIHGSVGPGQNWMWPPSSMFAFAAVLFLAALRVTPRVTLELTGVALLVTFVIETIWRPEHSSLTGFQVAVLFGFSSLLGYALRGVRVARGRLHDQEALTEEERSRRALLEERSRIARELHDVVAHHMSVISIQAQVAPYLVTDPPEELKENLAGIRQNALEALTELRRVLGVLRSESAEDQADQHHPQPTLADLGSLVDNVRAAGLSVAVETAGIRRPLTPGVELSAYRIVQEALSNCLRHAPGSQVEVGIAYGPRDLYLCVANTAPTGPVPASPGAGHGLLGMRERAGMLGGELAAGPRPNGGYEVSAVLPTGSVATPTEPKKET